MILWFLYKIEIINSFKKTESPFLCVQLCWFHCLCPYSEAGLPRREPFLCAAMAAAASKGQMANAQLCVTGMDPYHSMCFLSTRGREEAGLAANSRSWLCLMLSLPGQALRERSRIWCENPACAYHGGCALCAQCLAQHPDLRGPCSRGKAVSKCERSLMFVQHCNCSDRPSEAYPVKKRKRITHLTVL